MGDDPKFGMFGPINTKEACGAEKGSFQPYVFTWMLHVFPHEDNFKDVFSLNDDVARALIFRDKSPFMLWSSLVICRSRTSYAKNLPCG